MKKENFNNIKLDKSLLAQKRNYFLGDVILHDISKNIGAEDQKVYYAGFKKGAKTKIHYHEGGQTLVVIQGTGILVLYKKANLKSKQINLRNESLSMLKTGDVVFIPKNTLHWHGAVNGKNFSHIAINGFTSSGHEAKTIWYNSDKTHAERIL